MRTLIAIFFFCGCAPSSAIRPEGGYDNKFPNFHDSISPDKYCMENGLGDFALASRQGSVSWVDELFCVSGNGINTITATDNGAEVKVQLFPTTSEAEFGTQIAWSGRVVWEIGSRISLEDGLIDGCPNGARPHAIISTSVERASAGSFIREGALLCLEAGTGSETDLVLHGSDSAHQEIMRLSNITPVR